MLDFVDILGFEGLYKINAEGVIVSLPREKFNIATGKKTGSVSGGVIKYKYDAEYPRVCLRKDNRNCWFSVHRLVASHFIPNPHNYQFVHHLDGNKRNCSASNLAWISARDNQLEAYTSGKRTKKNTKVVHGH